MDIDKQFIWHYKIFHDMYVKKGCKYPYWILIPKPINKAWSQYKKFKSIPPLNYKRVKGSLKPKYIRVKGLLKPKYLKPLKMSGAYEKMPVL